MTSIAVRQSGGANIVSIPKAIIKTLGLQVGSILDLTIKDNKIVLTPINEELSLDALIEGSPQECFKVMEEDREWIDAVPKGKEV